MLNIIGHWENLNQNYHETLLHAHQGSQNLKKKKWKRKEKVTSIGENMEKLESKILWVSIQNGAAAMENHLANPQKVKHRVTYKPTIPLVCTQELRTAQVKVYNEYSQQHYSQQPKGANNLKVHQLMNQTQSIHKMEYYPTIKRNEVLINTATWMNLQNITVCERTRHERPHII